MNQWVLLLKNCSEEHEYTVLGIGDFQEIVLKYYSCEIDGCKQIPNLENSEVDGETRAITVGMGGAAVSTKLSAQFDGCSNSGMSVCLLYF